MDATDEGTEQNGGGPSGAKATKTQPQASQKQQQQPRLFGCQENVSNTTLTIV